MATANLTDMSILASDTVFGNRVLMSLVTYCIVTVASEGSSVGIQLHQSRKNYAANALNNPTIYKPLFVNAAAANQIVANDATVNGTLVGLLSSNVSSAATQCTDVDINNAVAGAFNAFIGSI